MLLFALEVITLLFLFVCLCLGLLSTQGNEFYLSLESLVNGLSIFALDYQLILSSFFFFFSQHLETYLFGKKEEE